MQQIKINVSALCETGGRKSNQDNIFLSCMDSMQKDSASDHTFFSLNDSGLPPEGIVLVVADGMGGMNVGEVASQLIVETLGHEVKSIQGQDVNDAEKASQIARSAVLNSDNAIKKYVAEHPEAKGTGSTIVMIWLLGDKAVVAWCGDSRCYRYNPRRGLEQLSHDHSYVQQLVDEGKLAPEYAFGHDQSNIITRCLSDEPQPAEPDVKVIDVYHDDMFLLCSDGLCGLLPDEVTEQLLKDANGNTLQALDNCWRRGSAEGWNDNVSIIVASVDGVEAVAPERKVEPLRRPVYTTVEEPLADLYTQNNTDEDEQKGKLCSKTFKRWILPAAIVVVVIMCLLFVIKPFKQHPADRQSTKTEERVASSKQQRRPSIRLENYRERHVDNSTPTPVVNTAEEGSGSDKQEFIPQATENSRTTK